jgi:hypothetical protein
MARRPPIRLTGPQGFSGIDVNIDVNQVPRSELGQHYFRRVDIRAMRCLNTGAISSWRPIMKKLSLLGIIVGATLLAAVPLSVQWSPEKSVALSLDRADARVGRPLTATSVAGVHRRAYRRAYRRGYYRY